MIEKELSLTSYDSNSLLGVDVKWNLNIFSKIKNIELNFSPDHAFVLNDYFKRNKLVLDLADKHNYGLRKFNPHDKNCKRPYFQFHVTDDKRFVVTIEKINVKNNILGKNTVYYRVGHVNMNGHIRVDVYPMASLAFHAFNNVIKNHNYFTKRYNSFSNKFDRFMRKYFSFYE